ncbi:MAG: hypothetical protein ACEQSH_00915 [Bacteroidia bacterium]
MAKGASQSTITTDAPRYVARRGGFQYSGQPLDRGQVLTLAGATNDEKLIRLGYVVLLERNTDLYTCAECGQEFIGISERTGHGDLRHRRRELSPDEEDARDERMERQQEQVAPLFLDKTKASLTAA